MRPVKMRTTSIEVSYSVVSHRRIDSSDNDSAISMSMDSSELEKQQQEYFTSPSRHRTPEPSWQDPKSNSRVRNTWLFLLPSFIGQRFKDELKIRKRQDGLATLKGLRGLASLIVLNTTFTYNFDHSFLVPYGINHEKHVLTQSPFVRVVLSAETMIAIFFVISGYVLSYKILCQAHIGNTADAYAFLTSSALRRGFRLYFPTTVATLIIGLCSWAGLFDRARDTYSHEGNRWDLHEASPPKFLQLQNQLQDVLKSIWTTLDVWYATDGTRSTGDYDPHTWTIPVQFRNSMILFIFLAASLQLRMKFRLLITLLTGTFCFWTRNRSMLLFLSGMLLADIDGLRLSRLRSIAHTPTSYRKKSWLLQLTGPSSLLSPLLFLLGLFICSIPPYASNHDPIYKHFEKFIPQSFSERAEWVRVPGALLIVWTATNSTLLSSMFNNRFANYFGNLSFSLYLVHGATVRAIVHANMPRICHALGDGTKHNLSTGSMVLAWSWAFALCIPLTIWIADLFWRAVDAPSVRFAKWIEEIMSEQPDEIGSPMGKRWKD